MQLCGFVKIASPADKRYLCLHALHLHGISLFCEKGDGEAIYYKKFWATCIKHFWPHKRVDSQNRPVCERKKAFSDDWKALHLQIRYSQLFAIT